MPYLIRLLQAAWARSKEISSALAYLRSSQAGVAVASAATTSIEIGVAIAKRTVLLAANKYVNTASTGLIVMEGVTEEDHLPEEVEIAINALGVIGVATVMRKLGSNTAASLSLRGGVKAGGAPSALSMRSPKSSLELSRSAGSWAYANASKAYLLARSKLPSFVPDKAFRDGWTRASGLTFEVAALLRSKVPLMVVKGESGYYRVVNFNSGAILSELSPSGIKFIQNVGLGTLTVLPLTLSGVQLLHKSGDELSEDEEAALVDVLVQAAIVGNPELFKEVTVPTSDLLGVPLLSLMDDPDHFIRRLCLEGMSIGQASTLVLDELLNYSNRARALESVSTVILAVDGAVPEGAEKQPVNSSEVISSGPQGNDYGPSNRAKVTGVGNAVGGVL